MQAILLLNSDIHSDSFSKIYSDVLKMAAIIDDFWSSENIDLLIDKRIDLDEVFKNTNSDKIGWLQVVSDMKKSGGPTNLNRVIVKRQWFKICETYKKLYNNNEELEKQIMKYPYYEKLHSFFVSNSLNGKQKKCVPDDNTKKLTTKFLNITQYADRWSTERTEILIDRRIARNKLFNTVGRGFAGSAWQTVLSDLVMLGEPDTLTQVQVKKKWENLCAKYKVLKSRNLTHTKWPHFQKLDDFFNKNFESEGTLLDDNEQTEENIIVVSVPESYDFLNMDDTLNQNDDENLEFLDIKMGVYAERWSLERTSLLIERRITSDAMFDGRGLSSSGWQAVLSDLKQAGAPDDLTVNQVKKKWENLCSRYKTIKDNNCSNSPWPYFQQMDNFLRKKYDIRKRSTEKIDNVSESCVLIDWDIEEQKLSMCKLCQQIKGDHSLLEDKKLCERVVECTSLKILENDEYMPQGVCDVCKTTIDSFYKFLIRCHEVDKELRTSIPTLNIKKEQIESITSEVRDTYECSECPASLGSREKLETHLKSHKKSARFHCEICSTSFTRQSALYSHIKRHFKISNLADAEDINENKMDYADNTETMEIDNNNIDEVGTIINTEISEQFEVREEIFDESIKQDIFSCELCLKTFAQKTALQNHIETHSRTVHVCPRDDCNKTYLTINSLRNHERKHLGLHGFLCMVCGKGFVTSNALKLHEKIHSDVKDYICDICSRAFSIMSNLRAHQKKHHEGHRFYCSQCPKEFLTKSSMQRHELVHTGVKEFVCDTCSSAFYTSKELIKHKRYHEGVRMFHCNQCFKTFYEKHHLTVHLRCHTGERPYPCKIPGCGKSFRESQKLSRHVKTHHRDIN